MGPLYSDYKRKKPNNPAKRPAYYLVFLERNRDKIHPNTAFRNAVPSSLFWKREAFPFQPLCPSSRTRPDLSSRRPSPSLPAAGHRPSPHPWRRPSPSSLVPAASSCALAAPPCCARVSTLPPAAPGGGGCRATPPPSCARREAPQAGWPAPLPATLARQLRLPAAGIRQQQASGSPASTLLQKMSSTGS